MHGLSLPLSLFLTGGLQVFDGCDLERRLAVREPQTSPHCIQVHYLRLAFTWLPRGQDKGEGDGVPYGQSRGVFEERSSVAER